MLLYPAKRDKVEVVDKSHRIVFQDKDISPSPLIFDAVKQEPGDAFEVVCNPLVPDLLFIYDARANRRGAWVDVLKCATVSRADDAAVKERMAEAQRSKHRLLTPLVKLGDRLTEQRVADAEHNNAVILAHHAGTAQDEAETDRILMDSFE